MLLSRFIERKIEAIWMIFRLAEFYLLPIYETNEPFLQSVSIFCRFGVFLLVFVFMLDCVYLISKKMDISFVIYVSVTLSIFYHLNRSRSLMTKKFCRRRSREIHLEAYCTFGCIEICNGCWRNAKLLIGYQLVSVEIANGHFLMSSVCYLGQRERQPNELNLDTI